MVVRATRVVSLLRFGLIIPKGTNLRLVIYQEVSSKGWIGWLKPVKTERIGTAPFNSGFYKVCIWYPLYSFVSSINFMLSLQDWNCIWYICPIISQCTKGKSHFKNIDWQLSMFFPSDSQNLPSGTHTKLWFKSPCYGKTHDFDWAMASNSENVNTGWWFGTCFIFTYIGNVIIPTDVHVLQRGRLNHQPDP